MIDYFLQLAKEILYQHNSRITNFPKVVLPSHSGPTHNTFANSYITHTSNVSGDRFARGADAGTRFQECIINSDENTLPTHYPHSFLRPTPPISENSKQTSSI